MLVLVVVALLLLALRLGLAPCGKFPAENLDENLDVSFCARNARPSLAPPRIPPLNGVNFFFFLISIFFLVFCYEFVRNSPRQPFGDQNINPPVP